MVQKNTLKEAANIMIKINGSRTQMIKTKTSNTKVRTKATIPITIKTILMQKPTTRIIVLATKLVSTASGLNPMPLLLDLSL
jgi:hypothetical protein